MNIFSNIGVTELIVILLLALLVVGPERLPELGRKLGQTLRDLRQAYENLTKDLGPEIASIQKTTQELRQSVEAVTSIPKDMTKKVVETAGLEDTVSELKEMQQSIGQVGATLTSAGKMVRNPVGAAVNTARDTLMPKKPEERAETADRPAIDKDTVEHTTGGAMQAPSPAVQDGVEAPGGAGAAAQPESVEAPLPAGSASATTEPAESDAIDILTESGDDSGKPEEQTHD